MQSPMTECLEIGGNLLCVNHDLVWAGMTMAMIAAVAALAWWRMRTARPTTATRVVRRATAWTAVMLAIVGAAWTAGGLRGAPSDPVQAQATTGVTGALAAFILLSLIGYLFHRNDDNIIRGTRTITARQLRRRTRRERGDIAIGGVRLPRRVEPLHLLVTGSTGTGKSVCIQDILDAIGDRGDRAIVDDAGGIFVTHYFDPNRGDVIANPLDARGVRWSPLAEMRGPWDADIIASSIVPDAEGEAREWHKYAQSMTSAILMHCWQHDLKNKDIFHLACAAGVEELRQALFGSPVIGMLQDGNDKMIASIRGIVSSHIMPYKYLDPDAGTDAWSLRAFIENDECKGWVFLPYRDDQLATLRPMIACMIDIACKALLSMPPSDDRRIWLMLDECASLGKVTSLIDYLTKARKAGGRAVIGLQSVAQLRDAYGRDGAQILMSCLSSQLILRCPDPETAQVMSRMIGDRQVTRVTGGATSQLAIAGIGRQGVGWTEQIAIDAAVMPAELQRMPALRGWLAIAGYPPALVTLRPRRRQARAAAWVARDDLIARPAPALPPAGGDAGQQQEQEPPPPQQDQPY